MVQSAPIPHEFAVEAPSAPLLGWRQALPVVPLLAALLASVVAYWPALNSPPYADDYLYLNASRELGFGAYARASLLPLSDEPALVSVTQFFWRPLYYLSFAFLEPVFGEQAVAYHFVLLGIHLSAVVLLWLLAKEITGRWGPAGVACVLFAAHPAAFEGVAWISSLSNVGLPLMLGAWLLFARATRHEQLRWGLVVGSALLVALALGFRESTVAAVPAIAAWWLLWRRRTRWRSAATYLPLLPFAIVIVVYELLRTRFLTEPAVNDAVWSLGDHTPDQFWYYLKVSVFPASADAGHWALVIQLRLAVALVISFGVFVLARRWAIVSLLIGFFAAVAPYAPLTLAVSDRYVYFPAAFLALAVAFVFRLGWERSRIRLNPAILAPVMVVVLAATLLAGTVVTHRRVSAWVEDGPDVEQAWVDELRDRYPELPPGATIYCANTPLILALFGDSLLQPTVGFYYPGVIAKRFDIADRVQVERDLHPGDVIFIPAGTPRR